MENCTWRNTLLSAQSLAFLTGEIKGCPRESRSALFHLPAERADISASGRWLSDWEDETCQAHLCVDFSKAILKDLSIVTSERVREPEFQLRVAGTFQKSDVHLGVPLCLSYLFLKLCYSSFSYLGGKASVVGKLVCCQHGSPKLIFCAIPCVFNLKPDTSGWGSPGWGSPEHEDPGSTHSSGWH